MPPGAKAGNAPEPSLLRLPPRPEEKRPSAGQGDCSGEPFPWLPLLCPEATEPFPISGSLDRLPAIGGEGRFHHPRESLPAVARTLVPLPEGVFGHSIRAHAGRRDFKGETGRGSGPCPESGIRSSSIAGLGKIARPRNPGKVDSGSRNRPLDCANVPDVQAGPPGRPSRWRPWGSGRASHPGWLGGSTGSRRGGRKGSDLGSPEVGCHMGNVAVGGRSPYNLNL